MRTKKIILLTTICLLVSSFYGYAQKAQVFKFAGFDKVEVSHAMTLYLEPTGKNTAMVVGDEDLLKLLEVKEEGGKVIFRIKKKSFWNFMDNNKGSLRIYLSYKNISSLDASGASHIYMKDDATFTSGLLKLDCSGASGIKMNLDVENLECDLSGASRATFSGNASNVLLDASGASHFSAKELNVQNANIDVSGASHISVTVKKSIKGEASGASSINYYGNPPHSSVSSSGASSIRRK